jgi:hypothetical protein
MSLIKDFWVRLNGSVHPDDASVFSAYPKHSFDLKFPPPAFIGCLDAPIVILMSNGGYKAGITEAEFPDENSVAEYRNFIRGDAKTLPSRLSSYYAGGAFATWIREGKAILVNAVAYRSPSLSKEPYNKRVAKRLRSLDLHRRWIMEEILPEATQGRRFLLVHRNGWWKIPTEYAGACVLFSDPTRAEPNRPAPDQEKLERARAWYREVGR